MQNLVVGDLFGQSRFVICLLFVCTVMLPACGDGGMAPEPPVVPPTEPITFPPPPAPTDLAPTPPVAFTGVNVVTMNDAEILLDQTVVVENAVVREIGSSGSVVVPDSATVIDAAGLYLMPGLADMHTHLSVITSFTQTPDPQLARQQGILLIANGVTTVMNMGDYERHDLIALRNEWLRGESVGPTMLVGQFARGPDDSGTSNDMAASPEAGRALVRRGWSKDYDFIKVYSRLSTATYGAIVDEASQTGLPVVGHLPIGTSLGTALRSQRMVAHTGQYFSTHYAGQVDESLTASAISTSLQNSTWVTATFTASESFRAAWGNNGARFQALLQRPGVRYTHPEILSRWRWWLGQGSVPGQLDFQMPFLLSYTNAFKDAGVPILLGTDAPDLPGLPSGFAVHRELELLVEAGFSPIEAIAAGTRLAGSFVNELFPEQIPFGTIAVGSRADFILLTANPLDDIQVLKNRTGVMARGVYYGQAELDRMLDELAAIYGTR